MKKLLVLSFLMVLGANVYAQYPKLESSSVNSYSGYIFASNGLARCYYTEDGVLYAKPSMYSTGKDQYTYLVKYPASKRNTSFSIPDGTVRICRGAFQGNKYIQTIRIPGSVELIGDNAFDDCENLSSIEVYESSNSNVDDVFKDSEPEETEVGRYNIQGFKIQEGEDGQVQIILYSDGTSKKVVTK